MDVERIIDELGTRVSALEATKPEAEEGSWPSAIWEHIWALEERVATLAAALYALQTRDQPPASITPEVAALLHADKRLEALRLAQQANASLTNAQFLTDVTRWRAQQGGA